MLHRLTVISFNFQENNLFSRWDWYIIGCRWKYRMVKNHTNSRKFCHSDTEIAMCWRYLASVPYKTWTLQSQLSLTASEGLYPVGAEHLHYQQAPELGGACWSHPKAGGCLGRLQSACKNFVRWALSLCENTLGLCLQYGKETTDSCVKGMEKN